MPSPGVASLSGSVCGCSAAYAASMSFVLSFSDDAADSTPLRLSFRSSSILIVDMTTDADAADAVDLVVGGRVQSFSGREAVPFR